MDVWLIHLGELLPIDGDVRLFRYGVLAQLLAGRGHTVVQWAPSFNHIMKTQRCQRNSTATVNDRYRIELLFGRGYRQHIGIRRLLFHRRMARKFARRARELTRPDVIVCSMPTPEMCIEALRFGRERGVPVVLDVRDLWPDIFVDLAPKPLRRLARAALARAFRKNRKIFADATAVIGISDGFLKWGLECAGRRRRETDRVFPMGVLKPSFAQLERDRAVQRWASRGIVDDGRFRLCFFGTFGRLFDMDTVIAAAKLMAGDSAVQFVLCGNGNGLDACRRQASGTDNVVLPGWVGPSDLDVVMRFSSIGLIPYKSDVNTTLPNKAIDYFSTGLPVLTTEGGEFAAFLKGHECGSTYTACEPASLIERIDALRTNVWETNRLSANATRVFEEQLDARRVYAEMIEYLTYIAGQSGRRTMDVRKLA